MPTLPTADITLPDFILSSTTDSLAPWFLDAHTGESRTRAALLARVDALAHGLQTHLGVFPTSIRGIGPVVSLVLPNIVDFPTAVWAAHRAGATVAPSSASATVDELVHQFRLVGTFAIFAHE